MTRSNYKETCDEFCLLIWPRLVRTAVLFGCRLNDAEDRAQDTLVKVLLNWRRVSTADNAEAYVVRMLVNEIKRDWRRSRHTGEWLWLQDIAAHGDGPAAVERRTDLTRALGRLPEAVRQTVVLRYYGEFTVVETARILNCRPGTVKSRTSRGLDQIKACLEPQMEEL